MFASMLAARKFRLIWGALAATVYFTAAIWLRGSFVDPTPEGRIVIQLIPPFERHKHAAVGQPEQTQRLDAFGDDSEIEGDSRSPIMIYENGYRLGPAHSNFFEIYGLGGGRFAHWRGKGIAFSASDNSDPNTNGRSYWAVLPDVSVPE
jgi:hypothetical protein